MVRIKLNHGGMAALLKSSGVRADLTSRMNRALSAARGSAPVATGAYRDGLHIVQATTDRAVVRLAGGTDHDLIVEANHGVLSKALDSAK